MAVLVFHVGGQRHAIPVTDVERVVAAVALTSLPEGPDVLLGAMDLAGSVLPAFTLRPRLGLAPRPVRSSEYLIVVRTSWRSVALVAERLEGVAECEVPQPLTEPIAASVQGISRIDQGGGEGLVLVHDVERLLSADEILAAGRSLEAAP